MEFLPGGAAITPAGYYNLWKGFAVEPQQGDWHLLKEHIFQVICNSNIEHYQYLEAWMALAVQKPNIMPQVAVVLKGGEGVGKGTFVEAFGSLFGQHYYKASTSRQITGQFSGHLENCVILFADEAVATNDDNSLGVLKGLITESHIGLEAKYRQARIVRSSLHVILASNNEWVIPAGEDARRFFVLDVAEDFKGDFRHFQMIRDELDQGGRAAFLYDLLNLDIETFIPQDFPKTSALADQKLQSLNPYGTWWYSCLLDGSIAGRAWPETGELILPICELNEALKSSDRSLQSVHSQTMGSQIRKMLPGFDVRYGPESYGNRTFILPNLTLSRALFETFIGHEVFKSLGNFDVAAFEATENTEDFGLVM
jgi:hypothetical protein